MKSLHFSKKEWSFLVIAGFMLLIAFIFDNQILNFIIENRISTLNIFMIPLSYIGSLIAVSIITTILFILYKKYSNLKKLWITLFSIVIITYVLKFVIHRARPLVETLIQTSGYSFPSGHATAVFSVLPLLDKEFPRLKYVWIIFAFLVLFSRVYLGVHYPSDVIAGAILGYLTGNLIIYIQDRNLTIYGKYE